MHTKMNTRYAQKYSISTPRALSSGRTVVTILLRMTFNPNPQLSLGSGHIGKFYQEDTAVAQFPILILSSTLTFKQEDTGKEKTC